MTICTLVAHPAGGKTHDTQNVEFPHGIYAAVSNKHKFRSMTSEGTCYYGNTRCSAGWLWSAFWAGGGIDACQQGCSISKVNESANKRPFPLECLFSEHEDTTFVGSIFAIYARKFPEVFCDDQTHFLCGLQVEAEIPCDFCQVVELTRQTERNYNKSF